MSDKQREESNKQLGKDVMEKSQIELMEEEKEKRKKGRVESTTIEDIPKEESPIEETDVPTKLADVTVNVEVIFGNTKRKLKELLLLEKGQVVGLQEEIDEPLHVYANGVLIAKGEIMNIDGNFGIRIDEFV